MAVLNEQDRRAAPRRSRAEIPQVAAVRVSSEAVEVINASACGLLVEGGFPLRPGSTSYIEIIEAAGRSIRVNGYVVRCQIASLGPNKPRYRMAIAFDRPVSVIDAPPETTAAPAAPPRGRENPVDSAFVIDDAELSLDPACALNNW